MRQNRFYSAPVGREHLVQALRYVDLNPVRARLVESASEYPWSSERAHISGRDGWGLLDLDLWREVCRLGEFYTTAGPPIRAGWMSCGWRPMPYRPKPTIKPKFGGTSPSDAANVAFGCTAAQEMADRTQFFSLSFETLGLMRAERLVVGAVR